MVDQHDRPVLPPSFDESRLVMLWLAYDPDGYVSGAGPTAEAAWARAHDAERLAIAEDDSREPPAEGPALDAELAARMQRHRLVRLHVNPADVTAFVANVLGVVEERVLQLIEAAVRAKSEA